MEGGEEGVEKRGGQERGMEGGEGRRERGRGGWVKKVKEGADEREGEQSGGRRGG